ncbi:hypothetical protein B0H34DRAFT_708683 [Crassisporium funariophilum]|nr:hypothetical protein B0H34DRAFT_708683 [Crassisporium funariophilum]
MRTIDNPAEIAHGPVLIGFTFNAVLLGVMFTQVYLYYTQFKNDKMWIKIFVAVLFALDILNTSCDAAYLYLALIKHFGDFQYLGVVTWLFDTDPALTGFIVTLVQAFFAWRIYILTKSWLYPIVILATAITGGITAILTPVEVAKAPFFVDIGQSKTTISIWLSAEVLGDIIITTVLVWHLSSHKTGFQRSDMIIDRIIRITIQTGLLTMIFAAINLIVFLTDPTGMHLLFNFPLCKLYSNSLMSTLNSRSGWSNGPSGISTGKETEDHTKSLTHTYKAQVHPPPMKPSEIINFTSPMHTEVYVNVESHELKDVPGRGPMQPQRAVFDDKSSRDYP